MPRAFAPNEVIDASSTWTAADHVYPAYGTHSFAGPGCEIIALDSVNRFIGFRLIENQDTLYGWIKVHMLTFFSMEVEEFACNRSQIGIEEIQKVKALRMFPNPSQKFTAIKFSFSTDDELRVMDITGSLLFEKKFSSTTSDLKLSTENFPAGLYLVTVKRGGQLYAGKLLVE